MKTRFIVLSLVACSTFLSCKKKEEEVDPYAFSFNTVPVKDAKLFFIGKEETELQTSTNRLYAIKEDGSVEQLILKDGGGTDVSEKMRPLTIANATPDYMLLSFARQGNVPANGYLLKKTDSSLVTVDGYGGPPKTTNNDLLSQQDVVYNGSNQLYFLSARDVVRNAVVRLSLGNPAFITGKNLVSDSIYMVNTFEPDADGNIMAWVTIGFGKNKTIVFNSTAAAIVPDAGNNAYWTGMDGSFRYRSTDDHIKKVSFDANTNTFSFINSVDLKANNINDFLSRFQSYKIIYADKLVMFTYVGSTATANMYELENTSNTPEQITSVPFKAVHAIDHLKNSQTIFLAAEDASGFQTIYKINASNNYSYTTYSATTGKYKFYEIEAFEDGTLYATAKRNSDGKNVILKYDASGIETLLDQTLDVKGFSLEKVSEF